MKSTILELQRKIWDRYSDGWQKWDEELMNGMQPITNQMVQFLQLKGDEYILDLGSGTGEPGLTISTQLPEGKVAAIDLSGKMVAFAKIKQNQPLSISQKDT